jgi:hypothetical protein
MVPPMRPSAITTASAYPYRSRKRPRLELDNLASYWTDLLVNASFVYRFQQTACPTQLVHSALAEEGPGLLRDPKGASTL